MIFALLLILGSVRADLKVLPPTLGAYHGAYADFGPLEQEVTEERIQHFQKLAGKKIAWAYFSNHWLDGEILFPQKSVTACQNMNVVPYIRMSPWSEMKDNQKDEIFSMQAIIDGKFDDQLRQWAVAAKEHQGPLMIEFGPEVNGDWFPWNGRWNGGSRKDRYGDPQWPDGPERFRDAYKHLIDLFRAVGVRNVTWVLHVDAARSPREEWNDAKYYYPGDDYIDWIGVSVFGRQLPQNDWIVFPWVFKNFASQIEEMTTTKPLLISEYAVIDDPNKPEKKAQWIRQALQSISKGLFKRVKGMTYWHSPGWLPNKKANFMIDSSPESLQTYRTEIAQPFWADTVLVSEEL